MLNAVDDVIPYPFLRTSGAPEWQLQGEKDLKL